MRMLIVSESFPNYQIGAMSFSWPIVERGESALEATFKEPRIRFQGLDSIPELGIDSWAGLLKILQI